MTTTLPANLPSIAKAKLPATYEGARASLEKCTRLDECADWADKAAALASYAKQAEDTELQKMAERIRARAIRRCGELLRAIKRPEQGGRPERNGGGAPTVSRREAARAAGLSKDQQVTATRVARIPEREFERAVESDPPPTVTKLLEKPKPLIDLKGRDPKEFAESTRAQGHLREIADYAARVSPAVVVRGAFPREHRVMEQHLDAVMPWLLALKVELSA